MLEYNRNWRYNLVQPIRTFVSGVTSWVEAARIPPEWLIFTYDSTVPWKVDCGDEFGCWPRPISDWTCTIVSSGNTTGGLHMKNASGLDWDRSFCVSAAFLESPETLGLRMWHEALHGMGCNPDLLNPSIFPNSIDTFRKYVEGVDIWKSDPDIIEYLNLPHNHPSNPVLRAYYYMLMIQNFPDKCNPVPLPPDPNNPPEKSIWQLIIETILRFIHA